MHFVTYMYKFYLISVCREDVILIYVNVLFYHAYDVLLVGRIGI